MELNSVVAQFTQALAEVPNYAPIGGGIALGMAVFGAGLAIGKFLS